MNSFVNGNVVLTVQSGLLSGGFKLSIAVHSEGSTKIGARMSGRVGAGAVWRWVGTLASPFAGESV